MKREPKDFLMCRMDIPYFELKKAPENVKNANFRSRDKRLSFGFVSVSGRIPAEETQGLGGVEVIFRLRNNLVPSNVVSMGMPDFPLRGSEQIVGGGRR